MTTNQIEYKGIKITKHHDRYSIAFKRWDVDHMEITNESFRTLKKAKEFVERGLRGELLYAFA